MTERTALTINSRTFFAKMIERTSFSNAFPVGIRVKMPMFGVHPVATMGVIGGVVTSLLQVHNPLSVAIILITSAIATVSVGTYGLIVTLTTFNLEQNPYQITVNNAFYAFVLGSIGMMTAYFLL